MLRFGWVTFDRFRVVNLSRFRRVIFIRHYWVNFTVFSTMEGEKFVETIRKGIDPQWSPKALARRYANGERTPQLVRDYTMLLMTEGNEEAGFRMIDDYFAGLRPKQRAKPENFFIFKEFTLSFADEKARYLYGHKKDFVRSLGRETTEELLARWLRADLIKFLIWREPKGTDIIRENLSRVEDDIRGVGFADMQTFDRLFELAEVRLGGNATTYLETCRRLFPELPNRDRLLILLNLRDMKNASQDDALTASALIDKYLDGFGQANLRVLKRMSMDLRGEKEYILAVELEGSQKGTALIMEFKGSRFVSDTVHYEDGSFRYLRTGKDTAMVSVRLIDENLGVETARLGTHYPTFGIMVVPGEIARLKAFVSAGKVPRVEWLAGGKAGADYVCLNHALNSPEEQAYSQLTIDNIIAGGDIREYQQEYRSYAGAQKTKITRFIRTHPESFITAMELLQHFAWFDENETEDIYNSFPEDVRNTAYARAIRRKLDQNPDARTGMQAPRFIKKDMTGAEISLNQYKGKYVLLDFWGTWCGPCRDSHPHMVALYHKFGKEVEFIHIAQENGRDMDETTRKWEEAVKEDGMSWTQILNNYKQEEVDIVMMYHVSSFPTKILIDPDGIILARYTGAGFDTSEALGLKLAEITCTPVRNIPHAQE